MLGQENRPALSSGFGDPALEQGWPAGPSPLPTVGPTSTRSVLEDSACQGPWAPLLSRLLFSSGGPRACGNGSQEGTGFQEEKTLQETADSWDYLESPGLQERSRQPAEEQISPMFCAAVDGKRGCVGLQEPISLGWRAECGFTVGQKSHLISHPGGCR